MKLRRSRISKKTEESRDSIRYWNLRKNSNYEGIFNTKLFKKWPSRIEIE